MIPTVPTWATPTSVTQSNQNDKVRNFSNEELMARIVADVQEKQFMVTGNLSRELYDESSIFTDEIDSYTLDQWTKGTAKLFVANRSHVDLQPNSNNKSNNTTVTTNDDDRIVVVGVPSNHQITFRFVKTLCFNVPILYPVVNLTGKVVLQRDPNTGLITSYQEQRDQDVTTVLKNITLFGKETWTK
jgi:hypothetical protein